MSPISCFRWLLSLLTFWATSWRMRFFTSWSFWVISFLKETFLPLGSAAALAAFEGLAGVRVFFFAVAFPVFFPAVFFAAAFPVFLAVAISFLLCPHFIIFFAVGAID